LLYFVTEINHSHEKQTVKKNLVSIVAKPVCIILSALGLRKKPIFNCSCKTGCLVRELVTLILRNWLCTILHSKIKKLARYFSKVTGIMSPDEYFLGAYIIKSVLSVHAQMVILNFSLTSSREKLK
jgi:hypothetical protein